MPLKPTAAAMRAGEALSQRFRKLGGLNLINTNAELLAGIIDAETGLPEMLEALEAALYGMDEILRSFTYTHVVRGQGGGQRRVTADDMSAASEADDQYQQARRKVEAAIQKARGGQ